MEFQRGFGQQVERVPVFSDFASHYGFFQGVECRFIPFASYFMLNAREIG
jgi:hypothetical protein